MADSTQNTPNTDSATFRDVLGQFPTGVTVVTAKSGEHLAGVTIGSFTSISLDPPLVGFFLAEGAGSWEIIEQAGAFAVNILADNQTQLSNTMAGAGDDKFAGVEFSDGPVCGAPLLAGVIAVVECSIERAELIGDHWLVVGNVESLEVREPNLSSLVFYRGQYGSVGAMKSS